MDLELVNLNKGLSVEELDALIGARDHLPFLNTRNVVYRERGMKLSPPSRDEALRLMSEYPNLIRRPLTIQGETVVIGFKRDGLAEVCEG